MECLIDKQRKSDFIYNPPFIIFAISVSCIKILCAITDFRFSEVDALVNSCAGQMASVFKKDEPPKASSGASASASGSVDTGMDDLLSKLKQLKAKAAGMTDDDRKKYAERVAMSFAEATGVDE